jgi:succinyl-CoA synthetase alpha subunit
MTIAQVAAALAAITGGASAAASFISALATAGYLTVEQIRFLSALVGTVEVDAALTGNVEIDAAINAASARLKPH